MRARFDRDQRIFRDGLFKELGLVWFVDRWCDCCGDELLDYSSRDAAGSLWR